VDEDGDNLGHAEALLSRRDVGTSMSEEEHCRLVHRSKNQCKFIKKHCPDDEGGFGTYLDLFYCKLSHAKPVAFMILISWLGLLFSTIGIAASDFFCINLSTIASILGMSESMAGVTLLAFGNGSPDVFSTFAAMSTNSGSLAVGELMGAAVFITSVVAGSMALIKPFHVARKSFVRDVGFFIVAAGFSFSFLWDGRLQLWECIAMVIYYVVYVGFVVAWHWWIGRRRREREKQAAARGHYLPPGDEMDLEEEYRDDPDSNDSSTVRPSMSRGASREDFAALERGITTPGEEETNEDEEEEARDRWISELNSNMRLSRPQVRSRRNTIGPVRPSLVGALEFQAVLSSLQKSRNIQSRKLQSDNTSVVGFLPLTLVRWILWSLRAGTEHATGGATSRHSSSASWRRLRHNQTCTFNIGRCARVNGKLRRRRSSFHPFQIRRS
jgi:solute carrier family 24 (sodium/potassium/calcium exchanger), member 6